MCFMNCPYEKAGKDRGECSISGPNKPDDAYCREGDTDIDWEHEKEQDQFYHDLEMGDNY